MNTKVKASLEWLGVRLPFAITLCYPLYFLLRLERISEPLHWQVICFSGMAFFWGYIIVFVFDSNRNRVTGLVVFSLYLCVVVGFASGYTLVLANRLSNFRIDQELSIDEMALNRKIALLERRLGYAHCIFTASVMSARLFGIEQMMPDVKEANEKGTRRAMLALFGGLDEDFDKLSIEETEEECLSTSTNFRPQKEQLTTPEYLDEFRRIVNEVINDPSYPLGMPRVIDKYWKTQKGDMLRKPVGAVMHDLEAMFKDLERARLDLKEQAYSKISYLNMLYFSFVVATTLGFGDIVPNTPAVRGLVIVELILAMFVISIAINAVARPKPA